MERSPAPSPASPPTRRTQPATPCMWEQPTEVSGNQRTPRAVRLLLLLFRLLTPFTLRSPRPRACRRSVLEPSACSPSLPAPPPCCWPEPVTRTTPRPHISGEESCAPLTVATNGPSSLNRVTSSPAQTATSALPETASRASPGGMSAETPLLSPQSRRPSRA